jgi:hypothetical protein
VELGLKKLAGLIECFFFLAMPSPDVEEAVRSKTGEMGEQGIGEGMT